MQIEGILGSSELEKYEDALETFAENFSLNQYFKLSSSFRFVSFFAIASHGKTQFGKLFSSSH